MRKLLLGLPVFAIAFIFGYATAHFYLPLLGEQKPTADTLLSAQAAEPSATLSTEPPQVTTSPSVSEDRLETIDEVNDMDLPEPPRYSIKLLETGEDYSGDDAPAKNGEKWLGLFESKGQYSLRLTNIKVSRPDPKFQDELKIAVSGEDEPVFLVRNAPLLKEGKVETCFRGVNPSLAEKFQERRIEIPSSYTGLDENFSKTFKIGKETFVLQVQLAKNEDGKRILALVLNSGNLRQTLFTTDENSGQAGTLYWIGDLDHDGKPDIYCDLTGEGSALFLSSKAKKGSLVEKVAEFYWQEDCC
jgi:hypothetical protein